MRNVFLVSLGLPVHKSHRKSRKLVLNMSWSLAVDDRLLDTSSKTKGGELVRSYVPSASSRFQQELLLNVRSYKLHHNGQYTLERNLSTTTNQSSKEESDLLQEII